MSNRILVTYTTVAGSTAEVAQAIGSTLRETGAEVDVEPTSAVTDLRPYDAFVVGSAIRVGAWLPDAVAFVRRHRDRLSEHPVAYFTVCMTMHKGTDKARARTMTFFDRVNRVVEPVDLGLFAGKLDPATLKITERLVTKLIGVPRGDFREFDEIRHWARALAPRLTPPAD